jgi:hypothetical protein
MVTLEKMWIHIFASELKGVTGVNTAKITFCQIKTKI